MTWRNCQRAGVRDRAGDPERRRRICANLFRTHCVQLDQAGWSASIVAILVAPGALFLEYFSACRRQNGLDLAEDRGRPSRRIDVVGQPFEPMAIADAARSRAIPLLPVNARTLFAARLLDLDLRPRLGRLSSASARHWSGPLFDKKNRPRAALRNRQLA
jgi:hypothetical protein